MSGCKVKTPHNNSLAADGTEIWAVLRRLLPPLKGNVSLLNLSVGA